MAVTDPLRIYHKDPEDVLDYTWDWADWLDGDTISSYTIAQDSGITTGSSSNTTTTVTTWVSGGTAGNTYDVECKIVTAGGRTKERSIQFVVEER